MPWLANTTNTTVSLLVVPRAPDGDGEYTIGGITGALSHNGVA
jgi:hypothetical protein